MGYNTSFEGRLNFNKNLPIAAISKLRTILGEDCRDHPEWAKPDLTYIDLVLTEDMLGIQWSGVEKSYDMAEKVNLLIRLMKEDYPDFELTGELVAQGEDPRDAWKLKMVSNTVMTVEINEPIDETKCYLVVCETWEYDDQYHYQPDDEGYTIHEPKLYTKEEAEKICSEMNEKSSEYLTWWDDDLEEEVKINPYKIIKLEI